MFGLFAAGPRRGRTASLVLSSLIAAIIISFDSGVGTPNYALPPHTERRVRSRLLAAVADDAAVSSEALDQDVVLVVGATGKVGRQVVQQLASRGVSVRAFCRDLNSETAIQLSKLPGVKVVEGVLHSAESLKLAVDGCSSVIDVHGTSRLAKLTDFLPGRLLKEPSSDEDASHPYFVNYKGVENLVEAAKAAGCKKFVRLTGLFLYYSAFSPVPMIFNMVLSMAAKWHWRGENALRRSGLDYTIIRPGVLLDLEERDPGTSIQVSRGPLPPPGKISRVDVAGLCIAALKNPAAARSTLACRWNENPEDSHKSASAVLDTLGKGEEHVSVAKATVLGAPEKPYAGAVLALAYTGAALVSVAVFFIVRAVRAGPPVLRGVCGGTVLAVAMITSEKWIKEEK